MLKLLAMQIFSPNAIQARRQRTAKSLSQLLKPDELLLIYCGEPIQKPGGLDQHYPFLPHPDYYWLTGLRRPSGVLAFCVEEGFVDFVKTVSKEEELWEGAQQITGDDLAKLSSWIQRNKFSKFYCLGQPVQKNQISTSDSLRAQEIQRLIDQQRRRKDSEEIDLIKSLAKIAATGYQAVAMAIRPGISEREIQLEYEAAALKAGAEKFPYETIVGAGDRSAVLHALPTERKLKKHGLLLIDAGADLHDYCVDITRFFFANGQKNQQQDEIYSLVLDAQSKAIATIAPGVAWSDIHKMTARHFAEGLKHLGILDGEVDSLLESGAISVFYPHGIGHMVGLRVRDVGPIVGQEIRKVCGIRLRVDLALEEDFAMTVEPGLYFNKFLLFDQNVRQNFKNQIRWNEVEKWQDFGGMRLEDDVLVLANGCEVLTEQVPK